MNLYAVNINEPLPVLVDGHVTEGFLIVDDAYLWDGYPKKIITCKECAHWVECDEQKDGEHSYCFLTGRDKEEDEWCEKAKPKVEQVDYFGDNNEN